MTTARDRSLPALTIGAAVTATLLLKSTLMAGWAEYGFCRSHSHSRWFWGLRLHLVCTPAGLPIAWALADPKIDERQVLMAICDHEPHLLTEPPGILIIADKGYVSAELDHYLTERGIRLIRPSYRNRRPHPGEPLLKSIRQLIESVNDTLKGQLNRISDVTSHGQNHAGDLLGRGCGTSLGEDPLCRCQYPRAVALGVGA